MPWLLIATFLFLCSSVFAQETRHFILATSRAGIIELIDPISLQAITRIHVELPTKSVGLNGASASADGSVIFVDGPIASDPNGCCSQYSIDLATLRMNRVASTVEIREMIGDRVQLSPDGHWLFGVRSFHGPALDVYDVIQHSYVRQLKPTSLNDGLPSGAWAGDQFYFYLSKRDGSEGRLWGVSSNTTDLGEGIAIAPIAQSPGCPPRPLVLENIAATEGTVFVYELFGFIGDRRFECSNIIEGGAWLVDPLNGQLLYHVAPDLHFSTLIPDHEDQAFYGLSSGGPRWDFPVILVRIDARDGRILQSRTLDTDRWKVSVGSLRLVPAGDVRVIQKAESKSE
jgi:hypothetical protein